MSRLLIVALLAELGYAVMNISTMPVYLHLERGFGEGTIGVVFVAFLLSEAIFKSPMGRLADRIGPKKLMVIGPAVSVITATISLLIPKTGGQPLETIAFIVLRAFDGLGAAMLWPAAFTEVNECVGPDERQQAMSLMNLCYLVGVAIAFFFGGLANDLSRSHYAGIILAAILFLAVSLSVLQFVPDIRPQNVSAPEHSLGLPDLLESFRKIPGYLILSVVTFAGVGFPMTIIKLFPTDQFGFSEIQIGALVGPGAIAIGIASVPMSKLADRIGSARSVHLGLFLSTIGMAFIGSGAFLKEARQPWILAVGAIPAAIGFLLTIPAWLASVSEIDPSHRGTNLGAVMTAQGVGAIIGAPLGAYLYERLQPIGIANHFGAELGRYAPFVGCALCLAVGWGASLRILKPEAELANRPGASL